MAMLLMSLAFAVQVFLGPEPAATETYFVCGFDQTSDGTPWPPPPPPPPPTRP